MKKSLVLCVLIFLLLMSVLFYAEFGASTPNASSAAQSDRFNVSATTDASGAASFAEMEIRAILKRYYEIANAGDREALKRFSAEISAPEYLYSSELGVMDKQAATRHFDAFDVKFVRAEFDELTIQVHGDDAAIAKYRDISTVKTNGVLASKPMQFTNVWVKRDGAWRIVAEHSSIAAPMPSELLPRQRIPDNLAQKR